MLKHFLCCALLFSTLLANAQQARVVRIQGSYDPSAVAELYNSAPIAITLFFSDSSTQATTGYGKGNYRWNKLNVSSSNGNIRNGILYFDRAQLIRDQYHVVLTVTADNNPLQTTITLPYITGIRFNHYADSIKRDIRFYLNVEGKFNSGKVFPLDTSSIRFAASDGTVIGQDLLLPKNDTIKTVTVEAWYKYNDRMYLRSVIPVKQAPDNDSLIIKPSPEGNKRKRRQ
ncbi:MAG: hypothetical protein J7623_04265 [Chitinophaga sp.]|uniref:hypothetical protein n=1 Tax=Chitinophaga sp. TaxID=1869181 RepID=UPI001B0A41A2|nr:hypothetical protein [Chitinophaga sp.]MBO9727831.1 hypothetical protein [Chitinophaga sp.]